MSGEQIESLLQSAYKSIEEDDLVSAMEFTKTVINQDAENPFGLEVMGYILLELNCLDEAKFCFTKSIDNGNNENHTPYLYLGQLTSGEESVKYFSKAADVMKAYLQNKDEKTRLFKPTNLDLSNCYVSLSEVYMTDLCDDESAEEKCRTYIAKAIEEDDNNYAAWQALASFHLILNDKEKSKEYIKKSLDIWLPEAEKFMDSAKTSGEEVVSTCELSPELRTKCAEMLYELGMVKELKVVLESLLMEDEEHLQSHYLMALVLEAELADVSDEDKPEMINVVLNHAEMAVSLADPSLEKEAVEKLTAIIEKYGDNMSADSDASDDEEEEDEDME